MATAIANAPSHGTRPAPAAATVRVRVDPIIDIPSALLCAWDELAKEAAEPNSFAERWFVEAGLRRFAGPDDVRLLQVWEGPRLLGLLPLAIMDVYGRIPVRHVQNWKHANDFLGVPLVRRGGETRFWTHALDTLDAADWAPGFLHLNGLVEGGPAHAALVDAASTHGRPCATVHRSVRALLSSRLSPDAYYADTVRKKKRKELGRLARRLAELGTVTSARLSDAGQAAAWCDTFLALEHTGWKGRAGSSLASAPGTAAFFRDVVAGALAQGKLEFRRMDLNGIAIAMLVNFVAPPGSFSFKTAFEEAYSRFSPGVLIQLDNLALMERPDIEWMDSCAAQDHPMIDSLWGERRTVIRVSVPLSGFRRGLAYKLVRSLERGSARFRRARGAADRKDEGGGDG